MRWNSLARWVALAALLFVVPASGCADRHASTEAGEHAERPGESHADQHAEGEKGHVHSAEEAGPVRLAPQVIQDNNIRVQPAESRLRSRTVAYPGRVAFNDENMAHVSTPVPGRVAEVRVRVGSRVSKGDVLLVIDSVVLGQAQSELLQRRTQVEVAQSALSLAQTAAERAERLLKEKGISLGESQRRNGEFQRAAGDLRAAQSSQRAAEDQLRLWGMAQADLDRLARTGEIEPRYILKSPIDGQIVERHATLGEMVNAEREAMLVVAELSTFWVLADVPEAESHLMTLGTECEISAHGIDGTAVRGVVTYVPPSVNTATRTVPIRLEVPNRRLLLKAGMFVEVRTSLKEAGRTAPPAVSVPEEAVQFVGGQSVVFLEMEPGLFTPRTIQTGFRSNGWIEIKEGLSAGNRVVVAGAFVLKAHYGKAAMEGKTCSGH
jgi:cobalt-zinc-cadmium efflux system membrane fusion protein